MGSGSGKFTREKCAAPLLKKREGQDSADNGAPSAQSYATTEVFPPRPANKSGISLLHIEALRDENSAWLNTHVITEHGETPKRPTMYQVVEHVIKPATATRRCAFAELYAAQEPEVFVSHWWGEEFVLFVAALRKFAEVYVEEEQQPRDEGSVVFWVCSLANRQWKVDLGASLVTSPFELALAEVSCRYVVMVMDPGVTPLTRIWCLYEVLRSHSLKKNFHIATENGVLTYGSEKPQGKQREDLLHLCGKVLQIDALQAKAMKEADKQQILAAIQEAVGVEQFSIHVKSLLLQAFMVRGAGGLMFDAPYLVPAIAKVKILHDAYVSFELRSSLHKLAESGAAEDVSACLHIGEAYDRANQRMTNGQMPLHLAAAWNGDVQVLKVLLAARANINAADNRGLRPLPAAALRGRAKVVKTLIESRADVLETASEGVDPLALDSEATVYPMVAATIGNDLETIQTIVHAGAKVDTGVLESCCMFSSGAVLECLLETRANPNAPEAAITPLATACAYQNRECVEALLDAEADVNLCGEGDRSPLMLAAISGNSSLVSYLLAKKADPLAKDNLGGEPLTYAFGSSCLDVADMLLNSGREVNQAFDIGSYPIHLAAVLGRPTTIKFLLARGADINPTEAGTGMTPLMCAAEKGHAESLEVLLEARADLLKTDFQGKTALTWAEEMKFQACAQRLRSLMAKPAQRGEIVTTLYHCRKLLAGLMVKP